MKVLKSLMALFGVASLAAGLFLTACDSDSSNNNNPPVDTVGGDQQQPTDVPVTDTPEPQDQVQPNPCAEGQVAVTFTADTNTTADGTNHLALVEAGEFIYITGGGPVFGNWGEANNWDPQVADFALTDNGDGTFSKVLCADPGQALEFKFLKTTDDPAQAWGNGMKDYKTKAEDACANALNELDQATYEAMAGGLWEVPNVQWTVPTDVTEADAPVVQVEAWRDYAWTTYGYYHGCD